jgi:N-acetylneuraminate synthase
MPSPCIHIGSREIGAERPTYVVAELSANHGGTLDHALRTMEAAAAAGADAVKVQTYTADTITIDCDAPPFHIKGLRWEGRTLHNLYREAFMPWEWQPELNRAAADLGVDFFSTPFDPTALDFLETLDVPVYKVASNEIVDIPLLRLIGGTGKPVILSTGMADLAEIEEAVATLRDVGCRELALLKCTSAYPAPPEEANLRTMVDMRERFGVPVGLSDHTMGFPVAVAAVVLGACIIEKHFVLDRSIGGPDAAFSMEPGEFRILVDSIRAAEVAQGEIAYGVTDSQKATRAYRRSLFAVENIAAGDPLTAQNIRSIRPSDGLHPRHYDELLGRRAVKDIERGTPLSWDVVDG